MYISMRCVCVCQCACACACACACVTALSTTPYMGERLSKMGGARHLGVNNSRHAIKNSINTAQYMYIGRGCPCNQEVY